MTAALVTAAAATILLLPGRWFLPAPPPVAEAPVVEEPWRISVFDTLIRRVSAEEGNDWRLLSAIAYHESRFTPDIVSRQGACGLMQIMPSVARQYGISGDSLLDPATNVRVANRLLNKIAGLLRISPAAAPDDRMRLILACYNGGIGHVSDARRLARHFGENPDSWEVVARYLSLKSDPDYYNHEVVLCGEFRGSRQTRHYVDAVMKRFARYCRMTDPDPDPAPAAE